MKKNFFKSLTFHLTKVTFVKVEYSNTHYLLILLTYGLAYSTVLHNA